MSRLDYPWDVQPLAGTCGQCQNCIAIERIKPDAPAVYSCVMDVRFGCVYEVDTSEQTSEEECWGFHPVRHKREDQE